MGNRLVGPLLVLLFGLAMLAIGAWFASGIVVNCDQKIMHPGDTCSQPKRPTQTYEERRDLEQTMGYFGLGIGSVVTIGGVAVAIRAYRRPAQAPRNSMPPPGATPPGAPPPYPPQYPPPPGGQPYYPPPRYPPPRPPWPQQ